MSNYQVYPKPRRGRSVPVRMGFVEENADTQARDLAGHFAAVTHEENGLVRFYIYTSTPHDAMFPNTPLWIGPYSGLSEEILPEAA